MSDTFGVKDDSMKQSMDLLPFDALLEVGDVLSYGAQKYSSRNWEKGMAWGRMLGAAMRHLSLWAMGQDYDSESGRHHLAHASCCCLMLLAYARRGVGFDDRAKVEPR